MADASATPAATNGSTAEYNLLPKLVTHMDRHMIFPLLEFTQGQLEEDEEGNVDEEKALEITKAKYELLKKTNMTDYVADLYCDINNLSERPAEFADRKEKVLTQLEKYEEETSKIRELLGREDVVNNLRSDKVANLEFLKRDHDVCGLAGAN